MSSVLPSVEATHMTLLTLLFVSRLKRTKLFSFGHLYKARLFTHRSSFTASHPKVSVFHNAQPQQYVCIFTVKAPPKPKVLSFPSKNPSAGGFCVIPSCLSLSSLALGLPERDCNSVLFPSNGRRPCWWSSESCLRHVRGRFVRWKSEQEVSFCSPRAAFNTFFAVLVLLLRIWLIIDQSFGASRSN